MVTGENRQKPGPQYVPLLRRVAAAVGQRATANPRLIQTSGGEKLREKGQLRIRRRAGFVIPADMDPATRRLDRKRLQLWTVDRNLCLLRLTHRVIPPVTIKPAPSLPFGMFSTVQL